jgi:hypothetical protein
MEKLHNSWREFKIHGEHPKLNRQDFRIHGETSKSNRRDLRIDGATSEFLERLKN